MIERRRAARLNTRTWTQVVGVDGDWKMRRCNLSVTGVFIEIDREVGEPGSVQRIKLMTPDRLSQVEVMSRVVRVFSTNDIWRGSAIAGVAFDFMLTTEELRAQVEQLVRYLFVGQQSDGAPPASNVPRVQFVYEASVGAAVAMVQALNVNGMVLETSWPAGVGEQIRCEITAPNSKQKFQLEGEVINTVSEPGPAGESSYHVEVRFHQAGLPVPDVNPLSSAGMSINDAIDALLEEAVFRPVDTGFAIPNEHLKGMLSRIRPPSLLAFLEMERLTGSLNLLQGASEATLYMRAGTVVDCDPPTPGSDRLQAIAQILRWSEGTFEFVVRDVDRPDMINMPTTHLILKLAAEADEAAR